MSLLVPVDDSDDERRTFCTAFDFQNRSSLYCCFELLFSDGRKKILIQRIDDMKTRTVTFNKRRVGSIFDFPISFSKFKHLTWSLPRFDEEGYGTQHSLRLPSCRGHFQW